MLGSRLKAFTIAQFHLLVLITPFLFTWVNDELFEFNKMLFVYALSWSIFASWTARMVVERRIIFRRTLLDIPILLFVLSQILATVFSVDLHTSLFGYYSRFHGGLLSTLAYVSLFYAFVNTFNLKNIYYLLVSIFASATVASTYAFFEHYGHSPSCWLITGGQSTGVDCWIQDVKTRVFGTFGQPNWLAAYLITLLPLWWWLTLVLPSSLPKPLRNWPSLLKVSSFLGSLLLLATLFFTQSRSGILGLGVGSLVFFMGCLVMVVASKKNAPFPISFKTSFLLIFCTGILAAALQPTSISHWLKLPAPSETTSTEETQVIAQPVNRLETGGTSSGEIRKIVWQGALDVWKRYPLFGSGVETFAYSYYLDRPLSHNLVSEWDFLYNKAHNEFLNFLATTGLVGLTTYLILLASIFLMLMWPLVRLVKSADNHPNSVFSAGLGLSLASGLVALSISNFFGFSTVMVTVLMFLFAGIGVKLFQQDTDETTRPNHSTNFESYLALGIIGICVLYGWSLIWNSWQADHLYAQGKAFRQQGDLLTATRLLEEATQISPDEALYYDELSLATAQAASILADSGQATVAAQLADQAIRLSDKTLELNDDHLNFYRTRARVFVYLASLDISFLEESLATLEEAQRRAPTDAKITFNRALVVSDLRPTSDDTLQLLQQTIEMKPNYEAARIALAEEYIARQNWAAAKEEYRYVLEKIAPHNQRVADTLSALEATSSTQIKNTTN